MTNKLYKLLYKYARNVAFNKTDVDDIVQEALLSLLLYPPKGHLTKALYYDVIKKAQYQLLFNTKQKTEIIGEYNDDFVLRHPDDYDLENVYYIKELKRNLKNSKKFKLLTPSEKKIMNMRLDNWAEMPEIAEDLNMNLNLAQTHNQMAIKKLKG